MKDSNDFEGLSIEHSLVTTERLQTNGTIFDRLAIAAFDNFHEWDQVLLYLVLSLNSLLVKVELSKLYYMIIWSDCNT